ncbi:hypothetical protein [Amphibacillus jilinensis]|uniref:hypothetical protein n=1 Tax=Amphibacillus jilinensis TaxID=1216008 RepID=UPI0003072204|nr:hypothetical protein [Amphibacillus jilinensis]
MAKLIIYRDKQGDYILERVNQFDHSTRHCFATVEGLKDRLEYYKSIGLLDTHDLIFDEDCKVHIQHLQN